MAEVRRLLPEAGRTSIDDEVASYDFVAAAHDDRPYTVTNFALTLDGQTTIAGRSGPIGSDTDTALLVGLRKRVDALLIGAGTMRAERYGRIFANAETRARRERQGLPADPLMVIVSASLELPWDAGLFTDGGGRVLIFTTSDADAPETATPVRCVRHEGAIDVAEVMRHLRVERGVRALLCEGGPHLHGELLQANLVDELFVTVAPKLAGGAGPGLCEGLAEHERGLELVSLLAHDGELYHRYRVRTPAG